MVSTFTPNKGFEQPGHNDYVDTWDVPVNQDWSQIDTAFGGITTINTTGLSGTIALTTTQYRPLMIRFTGTPAASITYRVPSGVGGQWTVRNDATSTVGFASAAGGATVAVDSGITTILHCDGTSRGMLQSVAVPPGAGGSNTQIQYNNGGVLAGSPAMFFDGTYLWNTGIVVGGNTILGNNGGNFVTINASAIDLPNNAVFGSGTLLALQQSTGQVGIGLAPVVGDKLTVGGVIHATSGGFKFPDNTVQTSAATASTPAGLSGQLQFNNAGVFGATANMSYNTGSGILTLLHLITTGNYTGVTASFSGAVTMGTTLAVTGATTLGSLNVIGNISSGALIGAVSGFTTAGSVGTGTLVASGAIQGASLTLTTTPLAIASGGTAGNTAATARDNLAVLGRAGGGVATTNYMTGDLLVGQNTTLVPGASNNTPGMNVSANGSFHLSHSGTYVMSLNRVAGDGDCIIFNRLGVTIGSISLTAAQVFYNTVSDRRAKTLISEAKGLLAGLDGITVYKGHMNDDERKADMHLVVADEIQAVVPEIVTGEVGGSVLQQVNWAGAVPWLIGLIKELKAEIEELKRSPSLYLGR